MKGALRAFLDFLRYNRNVSPHTRRAYETDLTQLLDSQQRFVADASHQLRTPLTALRLRLENLEADASAGNRERLSAAVAEVTRMTRLVDGLLILASGAGDRDVGR